MENTTSSFSKRVNKSKKQDFTETITLLAESSSSSEEKSPIDPKDLIDISEMIYTLSIVYLFGDSQIYANTKMLRLSEFNYRRFHANIIKRVETTALKAGEEFEYESGNAQMTMKNMNKIEYLNFDVNDEVKWRRFEGFVKNWMKKRKRDIHVKLIVSFKRMKEITNAERVDMPGNQRKICKNCYFL